MVCRARLLLNPHVYACACVCAHIVGGWIDVNISLFVRFWTDCCPRSRIEKQGQNKR